jgi:uncharacterized protein (UPF0335 family)
MAYPSNSQPAVSSDAAITVVPLDLHSQPDGSLVDLKATVKRLVDIEDKIDSLNKLKSLIYAEAKALGADVGALKSTVRIVGYVPESRDGNIAGLSETVKAYLDRVNAPNRQDG